MAITNAQQYKQLLSNGGSTNDISLEEAKDMAPKGEFLAYINKKEAKMLKDSGGSGIMTNAGIPSFEPRSSREAEQKSRTPGPTYSGMSSIGSGGSGGSESDSKDDGRGYTTETQDYNTYKATGENPLNLDIARIEKDGPTLAPREKKGQIFLETEPTYNKYVPSYVKAAANFNNTPNRKFFYENVIRGGKIPGLGYDEEDFEEEYDRYMSNRMAGKTDAYGNPTEGFEYGDNNMLTGNFMDNGGGDNNQTYVPPIIPDDNDDTEEEVIPDRNLGGLAPRFAGSQFDFTGLADGGRAGAMDGGRMMMMANQEEDDPVGGIMDLETSRQMYGLGKLVKKITRGVKKVAKSPVGKAALMYFGGKALMGAGGGNSFFSNLRGNLLGQAGSRVGQGSIPFKQGILAKLGLTQGGGSFMPTAMGGILGSTLLTGLMTPKEEEENNDDYYKNNSINIADIRNNPYNYTAPRFAADGGIMRLGYAEGSEEPVAKKTMPLLDMEGQEMDLREEGGFVPLGRMERADDVPARLSKNEFVFTADAVRNAGEGDVDKGAEVMYNMMKNLESGGDVSQESQGLEGAREMFQTSQRLEEVI